MTTLLYFKDEREEGFTLIELLVVILIIGILSAIAIPMFLNQRKYAVDAVVQSDITNNGKLMIPEVLEGKQLTSTVTINENGVVASSLRSMMSRGEQFDFSSVRVSEGTTLIFQPSTVNGGVCVFGVNPGGHVAAKSPGYIFDSNMGGLLLEGAKSPSSCASETGDLIVPTVEIEKILNPGDDPVAGGPSPEPVLPTPTPTPTPEPQLIAVTIKDKLADRDKRCYGADFTLNLTFTDGAMDWTLTGVRNLYLDEGYFWLNEIDSAGQIQRSYVLRLDPNQTDVGTFTGSIDVPDFDPGNTLVIDSYESAAYSSYIYVEYTVSDLDWENKPITKNCSTT